MNTSNFSISYIGEATKGGVIDAKQLSSSLLSLGELIDIVNLIANGGSSKTSVQIKTFKEGSFCVDLATMQETIASILPVVGTLSNAQDIVSLIFGEFGLIDLIKRIGARKIISKEDNGEKTILKLDNDVIIETKPIMFALFNSSTIINNVTNIINPLRQEGIEEIKASSDFMKPCTIKKEELNLFEVQKGEEQEINKNEYDAYLTIISVVFKENNKRRFSDGTNIFYATMLDNEFLSKVDTKAVSFTNGDRIKAKLGLVQYKTAEGGIKAEYSILNVIEYIPAYIQERLIIK